MTEYAMRSRDKYIKMQKALARVVKQAKKQAEPKPQNRDQEEEEENTEEVIEWNDSSGGNWNNWWHGGGWSSSGKSSSWSWGEANESRNSDHGAKKDTSDLPDILPDVVLGWLLLQKSGLDAGERATVLATTRNKLDFDAVEAALRSVWAEADLRHRDQGRGRETRAKSGQCSILWRGCTHLAVRDRG